MILVFVPSAQSTLSTILPNMEFEFVEVFFLYRRSLKEVKEQSGSGAAEVLREQRFEGSLADGLA